VDLTDLIERVSRDPELLAQLREDPAVEGGLAETLQARLSFATKGDPQPSPWGPAQAGSLGLPTN
jgi:hypothetical protein